MKTTLAEQVLDFIQTTKKILAWLTLIAVGLMAIGVPAASLALPVLAAPLAILALLRNPAAQWLIRSLGGALARGEEQP